MVGWVIIYYLCHLQENVLNLQQELQHTTNTSAEKLKRMAKRKEELSRQCIQIKKDSKAERSKRNNQMTVMVNASQDAIQVYDSSIFLEKELLP